MSKLNLAFAQNVRKRLIAAIISSSLLIVYSAVRYFTMYRYSDVLFHMGSSLMIWLFFGIVLIISVATALKNRRAGLIFFIPLLIQLVTIIIINTVPFYDIFTKVNFALYKKDRVEIVEKVQKGDLLPNTKWGDIDAINLDNSYPLVSETQRIYIVNAPSHKYVSFWIFYPGFLTNSYCSFLYVPEDGSPEDFMTHIKPAYWNSKLMENNWHHVCAQH